MLYGLLLLTMLIALLAQLNVKLTFSKYQEIRGNRGYTGEMAARRILDENGLQNVRISHIPGELTDCFNPKDNVVYLSDSVYNSTSVAALGVAAHEVGHAVQYSQEYAPMRLRAAVIPMTQLGSHLSYPLAFLGLVTGAYFLLDLGIILFIAVVFFQLVTLPVEFNASHRALATLEEIYILDEDEIKGARKVLWAAALTYLCALLSALVNLFRLVALRGRRN